MTHTYQLTGMTCSGCEAKVKSNLLSLSDVTAVEVSKDNSTAIVSMDKHISLHTMQQALGGDKSKYQIAATNHNETAEQTKSWLATYKPLLIIFAFITGISLLTSNISEQFKWMLFMNHFMAGFFITFSFFKLLNLKAFAESYAMYDVVARKFKDWGYLYAFIELALGVAYLTAFNPTFTNTATILVMGISSIGVIESVIKKQKIQCACLGAVFNLPMSTVSIIEDLLMVAMSAIMLVM